MDVLITVLFLRENIKEGKKRGRSISFLKISRLNKFLQGAEN